MVKGVIAGLRTLFWAIVLLVFVTYAVGVILRQTVGEDKVVMNDLYQTVLFKNMPWSMFMVFRCFTADCTLADGTSLVGHMYAMYGDVFMVSYSITIIFVQFGIFNLIAATFVESVMEAARQKRQLSGEEEGARVFIKLRQLILKFGGTKALEAPKLRHGGRQKSTIFDLVADTVAESVDGGNMSLCAVQAVHFQCGGQVTRNDFNQVMQDPEVHKLFDDLEVHLGDRMELFDVIDADGNGSVDVSELILGILKLRSGGADKSDIVASILGIRAIQRTTLNLVDVICDMKEGADLLRKDIENFRKEAQHGPPLGALNSVAYRRQSSRLTPTRNTASIPE